MNERRKDKRMELESRIVLKRLDDSSTGHEVAIEITDVSKSGVGFSCTEALTIGAVYESYLTIWTKEILHAFIEIVRIEKMENGKFKYGAIFIGMTEVESGRIAAYETVEKIKNEK